MFGSPAKDRSDVALVADVGRTKLRVGLTDDRGRLDHASIREYDPAAQPTISTAIAAFGEQSGLRTLPKRVAIAVSGVPRGDTISITNSRWILSRQGLAAMFQSTPLILNDFAANAWALSAAHTRFQMSPLSGMPVDPQRPGIYCIVGVGSGLGVALMTRDEHGFVNVLPTEGGHMGLMDGLPQADVILKALRKGNAPLIAEALLSGPGLVALHKAICQAKGRAASQAQLSDLLRTGSFRNDPLMTETTEYFVRALWHFAGNLVLGYGAWDGVILTGSVTAALAPLLGRSDLSRSFTLEGPYARRLRDVPVASAVLKHAELEGAAVALLMNDKRAAASDQAVRFAA